MVRRSLRLVALVLSFGGMAHGGFTSPTLVLSAAHGGAAAAGRAAAFEGSFDFANAVQANYPLNLVVFQGTTFVRYPVTGVAVTGTSAALADGVLDATEVAAFDAEGAPVDPGVRIVTIASATIRVVLPATFGPGPATGVLYTILIDGTVLSNAIDFVLP
jgi:hypothetical protein